VASHGKGTSGFIDGPNVAPKEYPIPAEAMEVVEEEAVEELCVSEEEQNHPLPATDEVKTTVETPAEALYVKAIAEDLYQKIEQPPIVERPISVNMG